MPRSKTTSGAGKLSAAKEQKRADSMAQWIEEQGMDSFQSTLNKAINQVSTKREQGSFNDATPESSTEQSSPSPGVNDQAPADNFQNGNSLQGDMPSQSSAARRADNNPRGTLPKTEEKRLPCHLCEEYGSSLTKKPETFSRKNDLKRHLLNFHNINAQWICPIRCCHQVFDVEMKFKEHCRDFHMSAKIRNLQAFKIELCTQTVFACGVDGCLSIFEADDDATAAEKFKDYVDHVAEHCDKQKQPVVWSYCQRMRNLLRQKATKDIWQQMSADYQPSGKWNFQTTNVVRKVLETRHIDDPQEIVNYALAVETGQNLLGEKPVFERPSRRSCCMQIPGHDFEPRLGQHSRKGSRAERERDSSSDSRHYSARPRTALPDSAPSAVAGSLAAAPSASTTQLPGNATQFNSQVFSSPSANLGGFGPGSMTPDFAPSPANYHGFQQNPMTPSMETMPPYFMQNSHTAPAFSYMPPSAYGSQLSDSVPRGEFASGNDMEQLPSEMNSSADFDWTEASYEMDMQGVLYS